MGNKALAAMAFGGLLAHGVTAQAHIDITMGGTHTGRPGDIKVGPCGGQPRGATVHTYKPGETINISVRETIAHPGYFRIAFDTDGQDGFVVPSGTDGADGDCGGDPNCGPGKEDYCNSPEVLLDHLDQHAAGAVKTYTWTVTLPNVECTNCTLQVIQMMNDLVPFHGPAYPANDIYYSCIDIVLSNTAADVNETPVTNNGMVCNAGGGTGGTGGTGGAGGVGGTGGAGGVGGTGGVGGAGGTGGVAGAAGMGAGGMAGAAGAAGISGVAGTGGTGGAPSGGGGSEEEESGCSVASARNGSGTLFGVMLGLAALYRRRRSR